MQCNLNLLAAGPGKRAHAEAAALLARFGNVGALLTTRPESNEGPGLDDRTYVILQAALELTRRHYLERMQAGPFLKNTKRDT